MTHRLFALLLVATAFPSSLSAQAPALMPVQGFLTNDAGTPVDGEVTLRFALYDTEGASSAVFTERQSVRVEEGFFDAYVGDVGSLDLSIFDDGGASFLGIQVESDPEMLPRISLGTVPYAAFAENARSAQNAETVGGRSADELVAQLAVPSGAVMMFSRSSCPEGWSPYGPATGRAIVGATSSVGSTVGRALSNREDRAHTHDVDPLATSTTFNGAHTHTVDPVPVETSSLRGGITPLLDYGRGTHAAPTSHTHMVDIPRTTTSSAGGHSHVVNIPSTESTQARTSDVMPYLQLLFCQKR